MYIADLSGQALDQGDIVALQKNLAEIPPCLFVVGLRDLSNLDRIVNLSSKINNKEPQDSQQDRKY